MRFPAVFLDRDGTLVHPRHYPSRPEELRLYTHIGSELREIQRAGFRLVVVTNQSGLARGLFSEAALRRMHDHLIDQLVRDNVRLDAIYHCPHHPDGIVPQLAVPCQCRKPWPGMLMQAARDLDLDLQRSWMVGDILDDIEAGDRAGCRSILVDIGTESLPDRPIRPPDFVARDTRHALRIIRAIEQLGPPADTTYRPPGWLSAPQSLVSSGRMRVARTGGGPDGYLG
jgi:D-glycero-D-manno-heptose 1,7-bisphosphate phosphatase